jgi:hypothetical protein
VITAASIVSNNTNKIEQETKMIDIPSAAGIAAHAYHKGASKFASRFDGLLSEVDRQSNALNQAFFVGCTDSSAYRSPPIFSGMLHQSSRVVDPASGDPDYRRASGRFGAVVADNSFHAQMPAFVRAMPSNQKDFK